MTVFETEQIFFEMTTDIDIMTKCRVCLGEQVDMVSLFESKDASLCDKIMRCARVTVSEGDGGPTHMCGLCSKELYTALKFKEKCEHSDKKIRLVLQQLQAKKTSDCEGDEFLDCSHDLNIKEESNNDHDNDSYDFLDNALAFKNEFLDDLKVEYEPEDRSPVNKIGKKLNKSIIESKQNHDAKESFSPRDISDCEDSILRRRGRKSKIKKSELDRVRKEGVGHKKRGRKPKAIENVQYEFDDDLIKVFAKELKCNLCKKKFPDSKTLKNHMKVHSKTRDHTCDQCGKQFKYRDNLKVHAMTHTGEKPFKCDLCDKSFSKKDNLAIHRKRHLKERNYSCEQCGSAYYTSYELKTHMRAHTGEKPHVCTLCGKRFTAKNNLYIHQRSHTGEKPHVCTVCGKQFTSKNILSIHSRIHTGEKPYICSVCGKRFTANKLAVHMRTHTGEKPHVCPLCGKQFSATNVLVIHMRRHTGEKPYECKMCGQTYGHTQSLNKHMRKQHKIVTNATQMQMQEINDAHRARLDERVMSSIPLRDDPSSPVRVALRRSQLNQQSLISTVEHMDIIPSADLNHTSLPPEILKLT